MDKCYVGGNEYSKAFTVTMAGHLYTVEKNGTVFCCVRCAKHASVTGLQDRS